MICKSISPRFGNSQFHESLLQAGYLELKKNALTASGDGTNQLARVAAAETDGPLLILTPSTYPRHPGK